MNDSSLSSFPTMDAEVAKATLACSPFVLLDGVPNVRDFGAGYPIDSRRLVKKLQLFRLGELLRICEVPARRDQLRLLLVQLGLQLGPQRDEGLGFG